MSFNPEVHLFIMPRDLWWQEGIRFTRHFQWPEGLNHKIETQDGCDILVLWDEVSVARLPFWHMPEADVSASKDWILYGAEMLNDLFLEHRKMHPKIQSAGCMSDGEIETHLRWMENLD